VRRGRVVVGLFFVVSGVGSTSTNSSRTNGSSVLAAGAPRRSRLAPSSVMSRAPLRVNAPQPRPAPGRGGGSGFALGCGFRCGRGFPPLGFFGSATKSSTVLPGIVVAFGGRDAKKPFPHGKGFFNRSTPAATYSPRGLPPKYHRRVRA
jgi:hypothetical protein